MLKLLLCLLPYLVLPLRAQAQSSPDTTAPASPGDFMFMADTLIARHTGREQPAKEISAAAGTHGSFRYERTLTPLNHFGAHVFLPFAESQSLRDIIRNARDNPDWNPFLPALIEDYSYGRNGTTRNSQAAALSLGRALSETGRMGYQLEGRYRETWGPFPNQQSTRLEMLGGLSMRIDPTRTFSLKLLGFDNGWHFRGNNTVYTDRARYILDKINPWRARTGGIALGLESRTPGAGAYNIYLRILVRQGASDPPPGGLLPSVNAIPPVFIDGVLPANMPSAFSSYRTYQTYTLGGRYTFTPVPGHEMTAGVETAYQILSHRAFSRPDVVPFEFDMSIRPLEIGVFLQDRFRFGNTAMHLGLRYDAYRHGASRWRDIYQTLGDDRVLQDQIRRALLASSGSAQAVHLLSPTFSAAYPAGRFTTHMTFSAAYERADLEALYTLADAPSSQYATRSNTPLHPRRRTTLEGGVTWKGPRFSVDMTAFYRNAERYIPVFGPDVLPQRISDYATQWGRVDAGLQKQRGLEATLIRPSAVIGKSRIRFSGRLSYLYLKDIGDVPPSDRAYLPGDPLQEGDYTTFDRRINRFWNRRHWLSATGAARFPSGVVITAVGHFQSGVPYRAISTAVAGETVNVNQTAPVRFGPRHIRLDSRIDLAVFNKTGRIKPALFLEVRNLLNRKNVHIIPDTLAFELIGEPDSYITDQQQWIYGPARSVWLGLNLRW